MYNKMTDNKKQLKETVDIRLTITKEMYDCLCKVKQADSKKTFQRQIRTAIMKQIKENMGN